MKKILFVLASVICALVACDPVSEDISNAGSITADELKSMTTVTVDKAEDGQNGNVITCSTSAPVNAKWAVDGKDIKVGNYAWKKLKLGNHTVTVTGLCADGTVVTADYPITCSVITQKLQKYIIYGHPEGDDQLVGFEGDPFSPGAWDAAQMRFSDNEGKHLPYLKDNIYWGLKTLIFDVTASDDCKALINNGWWSTTYADDVVVTNGLWELPLTEAIAKDCAQGNGGGGKDLQIVIKSGTVTINSVYYEE